MTAEVRHTVYFYFYYQTTAHFYILANPLLYRPTFELKTLLLGHRFLSSQL